MMFRGPSAGVTSRQRAVMRSKEFGHSLQRGLALVLVTASLCLPNVLVAGTSVDWRQAANNDSGYGLGNIHWVNSVIQDNNSSYFEGMAVRQRLLIVGLPSTQDNRHSLLFRHQFSKGNVHAYDFLVSYAQAAAEEVLDFGTPAVLNACGADIGPPGTLAGICAALHNGPNFFDVPAPIDNFVSKDGSTGDKILAYEAVHGKRTVRISGDAPISNAALSLCHDIPSGGDSSDSFVLYALTWESSSANILIEMAGHLAVSGNGSGYTWGKGLGSGYISGGSYHFKLDSLGGALTDNNCLPGQNSRELVSLGSQDNQFRSTSVLLVPPPCNIAGSGPVCPGSTNVYNGTSYGPNLSYQWSVSGNGSIIGETTNATLTVRAAEGSYTVTLTLTVFSGPLTTNSTCSRTLVIGPPPPCDITGSPLVCPVSTHGYKGPEGMANYSWSIRGEGQIVGSGGNQTVDVLSGAGCNTNFTLVLTVRDTNGCMNTCEYTVVVQDTTPPVITCPPPFFAPEAPRYSGGAFVNFVMPTATDNCTANPAIYATPPPGSLFPVGTNVVVGTAVDDCLNSNSCNLIVRVIPYELQVTSTDDSGPGTLRQALLDGNDSSDENLVVFRFAGGGPYTIRLASPLPEITSRTIIDGWSQSGSNANPVIELDGGGSSNQFDGLVFKVGSANSTVRGLALHGFATAIRLENEGRNTVQGNFIGLDVTGTNAPGNAGDGIYVTSPRNLIGGTAPGTGNVIGRNAGNGIVITSVEAFANLVQGNLIGVRADGETQMGNGFNGVLLSDQSFRTTIGGRIGRSGERH